MTMAAKGPDPYFPDDDPPAKPEPKSKKKDKDFRYSVALQTVDNPACYKDFYETDKLAEAKEKALQAVAKHSRAVIVWDRAVFGGIIDRYSAPEEKK